MTRIQDLIEIPERVHKGDFVLRLTEGVEDPEGTLKDYVVTPQLVGCFDQALDLIRSALQAGHSKAAYLHGSFGSGKSHFMAVLHLLLQGNPSAKGIPDLAPVVTKHAGWTAGRRILLLPFHMIGAKSLESAVLGGYVEQVRRRHPDRPLPAVYLGDQLFANARQLRTQMGDEAFFKALGGGAAGASGGWGKLTGGWTAVRFDAAVAAPPRNPEREQLISDLLDRLLPAYREIARAGGGEAFVSFEDGLAAVSAHAKALCYDGVVLFLDELILWLASHMADKAFVSREIQKVVKLVEAGTGSRPAPIVSFIARQRDLRELVGAHVPGAEQLGFADQLKHWEDRFARVTLEDRNLPFIAQRRILKPKSEAARQELERDFEATTKVRQEVMDVLLQGQGTKDIFRQVYPFSPAFMQALVAVSGALQRERTALKVMLQLLVDQRDTLELGHVVPVGDLFDVIAEGDEPFTEAMRRKFDQAKRLFDVKFLPMLETEHKVRWEQVRERPANDPEMRTFRTDARLVKTLLLSALVPEVEVFRGLTAARLAALNHGTIRTPIPGQEAQLVLSKVRTWATQVGELKISEDRNPVISIELLGIDTESILEKAKIYDNHGNRCQKARDLVFEAARIPIDQGFFLKHTHVWRGTSRAFDVVFGNVRELPDSSLKNAGEEWRLVIDFPFDEPGFSEQDDLRAIEDFRERYPEGARTICWVPRFFSRRLQTDLGTLVKLDFLLTGERFLEAANHLPPSERGSAKTILTNQRDQLRRVVLDAIAAAYGIVEAGPNVLDAPASADGPFHSLRKGFSVERPAAGTIAEALSKVLDRTLAYEYPAHPDFEVEEGRTVTVNMVRKVHDEVRRALEDPEGRSYVDKALRPLLQGVAAPLRLGELHENVFLLVPFWKEHFVQRQAVAGQSWTVANLRRWMDEPRPMGLPRPLQNLVILVFAERTSRSFYLHGTAYPQASLDDLPDDVELRTQRLPGEAEWKQGGLVAARVFGLTVSPMVSAASLHRLLGEVRGKVEAGREDARRLAHRLADVGARYGPKDSDWPRLATARAVAGLLASLGTAAEERVVTVLAAAKPATTFEAMGTSLAGARSVLDAVERTKWAIIDVAVGLPDGRKAAAEGLRTRLREAFGHDELQEALGVALARVEEDAAKLLASKSDSGKTDTSDPTWERVDHGDRKRLDAGALRELLGDLAARTAKDAALRVSVQYDVERRKDTK